MRSASHRGIILLGSPPKKEQSDCNIHQIDMESRKRASEETNPHNQCPPKKYRQDQPTSSNKTISITIDGNHENTLNVVKEEVENQQGKEMMVCGKEGIKGYINLGIPEVSHVVITFSKTESEQREDKQVFGLQHQVCTDSIKFYIHPAGKRNERILKCRELQQEGGKLCVYDLKGESIKDTLKKDGRFNSFIESDHWKLISDLDTIIENTQPVGELEGKLFQVEVERKNVPRHQTPLIWRSHLTVS